MNDRLSNKEVLAMYDVRGIQSYIFRSNRIQEIIGASVIVENIIIDGLNHLIKEKGWEQTRFLTDWENDEGCEFLNNEDIQMQVLFIGGGNAYVLFRTESLCSEVNKMLGRYILDNTYSLHLAVAVVEKTESYDADYKAIQEKMREIKARMPETKPVGILPFMKADSVMGYPLTPHRGKDGENICTESWHKQEAYNRTEEGKRKISAEKILDNMVTEKGDNSTLALVHIDGNNMGKRLMGIMKGSKAYPDAISTMRTISKNIADGFSAAYLECESYIEGDSQKGIKGIADKIKPEREGRLIRKIILAGDDITFICNAKAAIDAVRVFIQDASNHCMYEEENLSKEDNLRKYGLSSCAGIAYFNSHFPFRDAYDVAESCCDSAKKRAKTEACRASRYGDQTEGNMGSFLDYQICMNVNAGNLEKYREKQYMLPGRRDTILFRPYYVECDVLTGINDLNEKNAMYSLNILKSNMEYFTNNRKLSNSQAKKLRNSFSMGKAEVDRYKNFLESRNKELPETPEESWYDALEIMDYVIGEEEDVNDTEDKVTE